MGKWSTYQRRGAGAIFGTVAQPGPVGVGFSAVPGGVGVITVARLESIPSGATQMLYRAIDTTTQLVTVTDSLTLTGLVSGRAYKVQAAWFNGTARVSEWTVATVVNAG